jgi:hypothetical protein
MPAMQTVFILDDPAENQNRQMKAIQKKSRAGLWPAMAWASMCMGAAMAASPCFAQEQVGGEPGASANVSTRSYTGPSTDPPITATRKQAERKEQHRFWDQENDWLFAGVGASRTLDYFSTLNMRRRGRQEILLTNSVVDNHAAFAGIEAAAAGTSIGAAYLFHRYGHHKLERWTSIVHIGLTTTGAVRNYCLKTAHVVTTPAPGSP